MHDIPTVEVTRPALPAQLPTDRQLLSDMFYDHWRTLIVRTRRTNAALATNAGDARSAPTTIDTLRAPNQAEIAAVMPAKVNAAVMLRDYDYEVLQGGHAQWHDNDFSVALASLQQLHEAAAAVGIDQAAEALDILNAFGARRRARSRHTHVVGGNGEVRAAFADLDARYRAIDGERLGQAILDRFEDFGFRNFGAGAFR